MEYNKEHEDRIRAAVGKYAIANSHIIPFGILSNPESMDHLKNIGTSIVMNKWGCNTYPGSFVQAVLDNDLEGSINRADNLNRELLPFYVTLKYNLEYVS
jgi:hypothetical protein